METFPAGRHHEYRVVDASLALPLYKRLLVDPCLAFLPAKLRPNVITHIGHVACASSLVAFLATPRPAAASLIASLFLLHFYLWCDNVDGSHARNTGQTSTVGEYLDHGLDILNTAYIGLISTLTVDERGPLGIVLAASIAATSSVTCWEQATTGVFRLGRFNQIEAIFFLSAVMAIEASVGLELLASTRVFGLSLLTAVGALVFLATSSGLLASAYRVLRARGSVAPFFAHIAFIVFVAWLVGGRAWSSEVGWCCALLSTVAFGTRALRLRVLATASCSPAFSIAAAFAFLLVRALVPVSDEAAKLLGTSGWVLGAAFAAFALRDAVLLKRALTDSARDSRGVATTSSGLMHPEGTPFRND